MKRNELKLLLAALCLWISEIHRSGRRAVRATLGFGPRD